MAIEGGHLRFETLQSLKYLTGVINIYDTVGGNHSFGGPLDIVCWEGLYIVGFPVVGEDLDLAGVLIEEENLSLVVVEI